MGRKIDRYTRLLYKDAFLCMVLSFVIVTILWGISRRLSFDSFNLYAATFKEFSFLDSYFAADLDNSKDITSTDIILVNSAGCDRKKLAVLIDKLYDQKPKVLGVDIVFKDEKDPILDDYLNRIIKKGKSVGTYVIDQEDMVENNKSLSFKDLGYANYNFDGSKVVIRDYQGIYFRKKQKHYSFTAQIAKIHMDSLWTEKLERKLMKSIPINYNRGHESFLTFESDEVLRQDSIPAMKNAMVLLGYLGRPLGSETDIEDKHFTPLNKKFIGRSAPDSFGLEIHANILNMVVRKNFLRQVPKWMVVLISLILTFGTLAFFMKLNQKQVARYMLTRKLAQVGFTILLIAIALALLRSNIYFKTSPIIWYVIISLECIGLYKILVNYLNKKYAWKSSFYPN